MLPDRRWPGPEPTRRSRLYRTLLTAFFAFIALAYLSAGISGDQVCLRARTAHTIIGGILGTAIIALCVALSWVLVSFGRYTQEALTFLTALIYFALTLTAVMITMSAVSFYRTLNGDAFNLPAASMVATGLVFIAAGVVLAVRTRRSSRSQKDKLDKRQRRRVNQLAGGTLAYLAAASITAGLVLTSTSTGWKDPDTWVIHAAGWGALVLPLMVLLSAVGAIAHHVPAAAPASGGKQAPAPGVPGARKPDETTGSQ
ncbi:MULTISPECIES: hypothetical protein [Actinomadura]|uniref:hypothetical protein n=1 Tax=unclassified Actinomadura TaxID=2626254 RepID=UPI0033969602